MYYRVNNKRVAETFYPQLPPPPTASASTGTPSPAKKKPFPIWALVLIILAALAVTGVVIYFAFSKPAQKFGYKFY